jgi:ferric-dicitrate binding protein FerR (iron transport regulator)
MENTSTYYETLITRYLSGETTPEEMFELSQWLSADEANLSVFEGLHNAWLLNAKVAIDDKTDIDQQWKIISEKLNLNAEPVKQSKSGSKSKIIKMLTAWNYAAAVAVILVVAGALWFLLPGSETVITAQNEILAHALPDGSIVTLSAGSEISYNKGFGKNTRDVELSGEAYFEVTPDASHPFVVSGNDARIEVLGTAFNVRAKENEEQVEVVLTSGKVSLYFAGSPDKKEFLDPGESASLNVKNKEIGVSANADPNYLAWKTRLITFDDASLSEVAETLTNVYRRKFVLDNQLLNNCRLTATFDNQSLESVLGIIGNTLDVEFRENDGITVIYGSGCK